LSYAVITAAVVWSVGCYLSSSFLVNKRVETDNGRGYKAWVGVAKANSCLPSELQFEADDIDSLRNKANKFFGLNVDKTKVSARSCWNHAVILPLRAERQSK
jgi:hypothetical protein